jgi:hypothetical protein
MKLMGRIGGNLEVRECPKCGTKMIGDRVRIAVEYSEEEECRECKGKKEVDWLHLDGTTETGICPRCRGTGKESEIPHKSKEIEPLKGDWVTDTQAINKLCKKLDELIKVVNTLTRKQ